MDAAIIHSQGSFNVSLPNNVWDFFAHQFDICNRTYSMELVRSHYCSIADMKVVDPPSIGPAIRQYRILWVRRRAHHRKYSVPGLQCPRSSFVQAGLAWLTSAKYYLA